MIPYIHIPELSLGPLTIHPFGLLVATGVIVGTHLANQRARLLDVDLDLLSSFITWMLVSGGICAHVLDEIFYHPDELAHPLSLLKVWNGLSSFGGFVGALIGVLAWKYFTTKPVAVFQGMSFTRIALRDKPMPILPLCDLILAVFPVAWIFGRSGCTVAHDHPGALAPPNAFLSVAYGAHPTMTKIGFIELFHGIRPQWDLGFLELLFTIVLSFLLILTWHRKVATGSYIVVTTLAYAPVRFAMDSLRITDGPDADPRYGGFTPAQWCCIVLFVYGLVMWGYVWSLSRRGIEPLNLVKTVHPPELDLPAEEAALSDV